MDNEKINKQEANTEFISLEHVFSILWKKAWLILLCGILLGGAFFYRSKVLVSPKYSSTVMMYVNNSSIQVGGIGVSLSSSELATSQYLVRTYITILRTRDTLQLVIKESGTSYTYGQLLGMISADAVDNTAIFKVTVTAGDPYEAAKLANTISQVLPERVVDIIDGSSVRLVSAAVPELGKVSPNVSKDTAIGFLLGIVLCCGVIIVLDLLDDVVRDDEYITKTYDYPILARVPDMLTQDSGRYGLYKKTGSSKGAEGKS